MRRSKQPISRGFTLVELAMVAAIMSIMAVIALPRYTRSLQRYHAETAAYRIAADIELAKQSAIHASATRFVVFNSAALTYFITNVENLDHRTGGYQVSLKRAPYNVDQFSVVFSNPDAVVLKFDGFGNLSTSATITIQAGNDKKQVVVDGDTGKATVK